MEKKKIYARKKNCFIKVHLRKLRQKEKKKKEKY